MRFEVDRSKPAMHWVSWEIPWTVCVHNSKPKAAEAMPVVSEEADDAKRYRGAALQHNLWIDVVGHSTMQYTIGKAMRAVGFSEADSKDPTKQMRVRRLKNSSPMSAATTPTAIVAAAVVTPVSEVIKPIAASSTALSARNDLLGGCRRTQQQMHAANRVKFETLTADQENFKNCTSWIAQEQSKHPGIGKKKGVKPLLVEYSEMKNIPLASLPSDRTIRRALQNGKEGQTPPRRGPKGNIDESDFSKLAEAVRAHIVLCGCCGDEKTLVDLKKLVNNVANSKEGKQFPDRTDYGLINRIIQQFGVDLNVDKLSRAEARRVLWTTKHNLDNMFDRWKELLIELQFAEEKTDTNTIDAVELTLENIEAGHTIFCTGELIFTLDQLRRIVNIDETALSLDGLDGNRGGRPSLSFHDPNLPRPGKAASKSGYSATLVCGGNAAGEAAPPHFQFPSTAQEQNQQMRFSTIADGRDVVAQFGNATPIPLSPSYRMNERGGMDEVHFELYLLGLFGFLFPDAADIPGKRVIIKCDQGPGRSNLRLLARLRARGFYMFPSVPNSSSVTQEMDQLFGLFKSKLRNNLDRLHDALMAIGKSVSLGRDDCCRIVFGGECLLDDGSTIILDEAFDQAFGPARMLAGFAKVGAAPLTRKCLSDEKVRIEINVDGDESESAAEKRIRLVENQLSACVSYLQLSGFLRADLLLVPAKRKQPRSERHVTLAHSLERQLAILQAKTTGAKYVAMDGTHLTHDDMFIVDEIRRSTVEEWRQSPPSEEGSKSCRVATTQKLTIAYICRVDE